MFEGRCDLRGGALFRFEGEKYFDGLLDVVNDYEGVHSEQLALFIFQVVGVVVLYLWRKRTGD